MRLNKSWQLWLLGFLVGMPYLNALSNDFISDDKPSIVEFPPIESVIASFQHQPLAAIRPIINSIIHQTIGDAAWAYRLPNLLFHAGTVVVLFLLLTRLTERYLSHKGMEQLPLVASLIFAVHPLLSEGVSWISGGVYPQMAFFFLSSFYLYIKDDNPSNLWRSLASIVLFSLALQSNDKAIPLCLIFPLYELSFGNYRTFWPRSIPYIILSATWASVYYFGEFKGRVSDLTSIHQTQGGVENPLIQLPLAITTYIELFFWPKVLTLYHSELTMSGLEYGIRILGLLGVLGLLVWGWFKDRWIFFWLSFFIISLLLTLTPLRIAWIVAERYVYLGTLGLLAIVLPLILTGFSQLESYTSTVRVLGNDFWKHVRILLLVLLLSASTVRIMVRNLDWRSEDTLWLAMANTSPSSPQNHNNLGDYYARQGDLPQAAEAFRQAIALKPDYADAYHNLGNTLSELNQTEQAINAYQQAIHYKPSLWQSHLNLSLLLAAQGNKTEAATHLQEAQIIRSKLKLTDMLQKDAFNYSPAHTTHSADY